MLPAPIPPVTSGALRVEWRSWRSPVERWGRPRSERMTATSPLSGGLFATFGHPVKRQTHRSSRKLRHERSVASIYKRPWFVIGLIAVADLTSAVSASAEPGKAIAVITSWKLPCEGRALAILIALAFLFITAVGLALIQTDGMIPS